MVKDQLIILSSRLNWRLKQSTLPQAQKTWTYMEATAEQRAAATGVNLEASKTLSAALRLDDRGTPNRRVISLSTRRSGSEESNGKRSRPLVPAASEQEQPKQRKTAGRDYATEPPLNDQTMGGEPLPVNDIEATRQRDLAKEREIEDEVKQCCNHIKWKRNKDPKDADTWFYDLRYINSLGQAVRRIPETSSKVESSAW